MNVLKNIKDMIVGRWNKLRGVDFKETPPKVVGCKGLIRSEAMREAQECGKMLKAGKLPPRAMRRRVARAMGWDWKRHQAYTQAILEGRAG